TPKSQPPTPNSQPLFRERCTQCQRECLMFDIICCDGSSLCDFTLVPIGLLDCQGDHTHLAGSDNLVELACGAAARWSHILDLQIYFSFVLDLERIRERRACLHRTERVLQRRNGHFWFCAILRC